MNFLSLIASLLCLVNMTSTAANAANIHLTNVDYTLVSAKLDENRFAASNVLITLTNVSDSTLNLQILNDICPKIPGKFSCMAMAFPMFTGDFTLGEVTIDSCGVRTQMSNVLLQNGEIAQLEVKNYRQMICEIYYLADMQITLKLKSDNQESVSTLLVSKQKITSMPVIKAPGFLYNPIADQQFFSKGTAVTTGKFFEDAVDLNAEVLLNRMDKKIELAITANPCAHSVCEAIKGDIIRRTLNIESVKSNKCNEKTYVTNSVSVYDAYPAVVGAIHTFVSAEIVDTRYSVCDRNNGSVTAVVTVTQRQKLVQDVVVDESQATFQLAQPTLTK